MTTKDTSRDNDLPSTEQVDREWLAGRIYQVARDLRDLADRVDEMRDDVGLVSATDGRSYESYASVVSRTQHLILWRLANLKLDALVRAAYAADASRLASGGDHG